MAKGTELAVGYISLVAETSKLSKGINHTLEQAGLNADKTGKKMGRSIFGGVRQGVSHGMSGMGGQADQIGHTLGQRMGSRMSGAMGNALRMGLTTAGVAGGLAGVTAAMTSAVKSGVQFQTGMNRIQGVLNADAATMEKFKTRASELGQDVSLVGVSAQNATEAMLELTKGGFNAQQAMDAAKGTMQLASAAGVDAAAAATIQADALHAFGMEADQAGRMADILANVANASTGEMTDFAFGLQAGGAVMNQYGINAEDAATALGLLANSGIKGSDAGTLLKSALLHMANPSKKAYGAMQELGLSIWDAEGRFLGLREMMDQLQRASTNMTNELFAQNVALALGSDAARIGGVAAEQGAQGWDAMSKAIHLQGSAALLAQANTAGLPGVFERLSNTADRAKLAVFDLVSGPLGSLGDLIDGGINSVIDQFEGGGVGVFRNLADALQSAWPAIRGIGEALAQAAQAIGTGAWTALEHVFSAIAGTTQVIAPALRTIAGFIGDNASLVSTLATAWVGMRFVPGLLGRLDARLSGMATNAKAVISGIGGVASANQRLIGVAGMGAVQMGRFGSVIQQIGSHVPVISRMQTAFFNSATQAGRFGRSAGAAAAAMTGMRAAGSGLMGALGGPWAAALTTLTVGVTMFADSLQKANQRGKLLRETSAEIAASQRDMFDSLIDSGGNVDDTVIGQLSGQFGTMKQRIDELRRGPALWDWAIFPRAASMQADAERFESVAGAVEALGVSSQVMAKNISASDDAWQQFTNELYQSGEGGRNLLDVLRPLRETFISTQDAATSVTPGLAAVSDAFAVMADSSKSAEEHTSALKRALDALAGDRATAQQADAEQAQATRDNISAANDLAKALAENNDVLTDQNGRLDVTTKSGKKFMEMLLKLRDETAAVATSGGDLDGAFARDAQTLQAFADATRLPLEQVQQFARELGYLPEVIAKAPRLEGVDDTVSDVAKVTSAMQALGTDEPKTVTVKALTDDAVATLTSIPGIDVTKQDFGNGVYTFKITADSEEAIQALDTVEAEMLSRRVQLRLGLDTTVLELNTDKARKIIQFLDEQKVSPKAQLVIDALKEGKSIAVEELADLSRHSANPRVFLENLEKTLNDLGLVSRAADEVARPRSIPFKPQWLFDPASMPPEIRRGTKSAPVAKLPGGNGIPIPAEIASGGPERPQTRAAGGSIFGPGTRTSDSIPILASNDEHMWSAREVAGAGGHSNVESLRALARAGLLKQLLPGFRGGGRINPQALIPYEPDLQRAIDADRRGNQPSMSGPTQAGTEQMWPDWTNIVPNAPIPPGFFERPVDPNRVLFPELLPWYLRDEVQRRYGPRHIRGYATGGPVTDDPLANLPSVMGNDGATIDHGIAAAMAAQQQQQQNGDAAGQLPEDVAGRTEGYIPAGAGSTGVPGTSFASGLLNMGAEAINGLIDQAASAAATAASAAATAGTFGAGGQAGGAAASFLIGMGTNAAKRGVKYGFQMAGIGVDSLVEQLFPFGAPRWLGYDYTGFIPQAPNQSAATTTAEQLGPSGLPKPPYDPNAPLLGGEPGPRPGPAPAPAGGALGGLLGGGTGLPPGIGNNPATQPMPKPPSDPFGTQHGPGVPAITAPGPDPNKPPPQKPIFQFDRGGYLESGMVAANLLDQPEVVLTPHQWENISAAAAAEPLEPAMAQGNDYSIHLENVQVKDVGELERQLSSRQRLQMMRYAGRP